MNHPNRDSRWMLHYEELKNYEKTHGTQRIPNHDTAFSSLRSWCNTQRTYYNKQSLSDIRITRLIAIHFNFSPYESQWEKWFSELESYRRNNGHISLPYRSKSNYKLSIWLHNQKRLYLKGSLSEVRYGKLKKLGVEWATR